MSVGVLEENSVGQRLLGPDVLAGLARYSKVTSRRHFKVSGGGGFTDRDRDSTVRLEIPCLVEKVSTGLHSGARHKGEDSPLKGNLGFASAPRMFHVVNIQASP